MSISIRSDNELTEYLMNCDSTILFTVIDHMQTIWSRKVKKLRRYESVADIPDPDSDERKSLSEEIVFQLKYFGSNSITFFAKRALKKEPGNSYLYILKDVLKKVKKIYKDDTEIPPVCSVNQYENYLVDILLHGILQDKTDEEIAYMFHESNMDKEAILKAVKFYLTKDSVGGGLPILVKMLGKKAIKEIILKLVEYIPGFLGKDILVLIAERLAKKLPQKFFARAVSGVGVVLLASDVWFLSYPATRITIPCVSYIACHRVIERVNEDGQEES